MKLTSKSVAALKLPAGKTDHFVFDDDVPGFGLRFREGGGASWVFQYALGRTKQRRMVIGKATAIPLGRARDLAGELHAKVKLGGDPAADKARPTRSGNWPGAISNTKRTIFARAVRRSDAPPSNQC